MKLLDQIPFSIAVILALTLGLAPFFPQPHLFEKAVMLFSGRLIKPLDIFDLLLHGAPVVLLALKLGVLLRKTS